MDLVPRAARNFVQKRMITVAEASTDTEWEQALAVMHAVYVGEGYTSGEAAQQNMLREKFAAGGTLLITKDENGDVSGATLLLHADSPLKQIARDGEREFRVLAVRADARGSGAGEALVRACIARAEMEASALVLWTQPRMNAAQRLYERLGFVRDPARDVPDPRGFIRLVYVRSFAT